MSVAPLYRVTIDGVVVVDARWPWHDRHDDYPTHIIVERGGRLGVPDGHIFLMLCACNKLYLQEFVNAVSVRTVICRVPFAIQRARYAGTCFQCAGDRNDTVCFAWPPAE